MPFKDAALQELADAIIDEGTFKYVPFLVVSFSRGLLIAVVQHGVTKSNTVNGYSGSFACYCSKWAAEIFGSWHLRSCFKAAFRCKKCVALVSRTGA